MKNYLLKFSILYFILALFSLSACDSGGDNGEVLPPDYIDPNDKKPDGGGDEGTTTSYKYIIPEVDESGRIIVSGQPPQYTDTAKYHVVSVAYDIAGNTSYDIKSYYSAAVGKKGDELRAAIAEIITKNHYELTYTPGIWELTKEADEDPLDNTKVWLSYEEMTNLKSNQQGSENGTGKWNREHIWARSRGVGETADKGAATDGHNLRAEDSSVNSDKSNRDFEEKPDDVNFYGTHGDYSYVPMKSARGDVARTLMYMAVRWNKDNKLVLDDRAYNSANEPRQGKLTDLLKWHSTDPVDPYEIKRNNVVFKFQKNRNPFVDHPELVDFIFGDKQNEEWDGGVIFSEN
ncbi:endonuclease I family protein [Carboxylicivirga taeanensis]|uniref:endonuclease I family protein n=1 Tax=Carboxylicivirga taeanensis TaxID=1416875 RepID=UPI003F6DEBE0